MIRDLLFLILFFVLLGVWATSWLVFHIAGGLILLLLVFAVICLMCIFFVGARRRSNQPFSRSLETARFSFCSRAFPGLSLPFLFPTYICFSRAGFQLATGCRSHFSPRPLQLREQRHRLECSRVSVPFLSLALSAVVCGGASIEYPVRGRMISKATWYRISVNAY
jgi:hypothetical protein